MIDKKELQFTQQQIDAMDQDKIDVINEQIKEYSREHFSAIQRKLSSKTETMAYFIRKWHNSSKAKNTFWRYRAAVELILQEAELDIQKLTTGFKVTMGDIDKDLYQVEIIFDKDGYNDKTTRWIRVHRKTKVRTPEEQAEYDKEIKERIKAKDKKQFEANCSKWDLSKDIFGKTFKHKNGNKYVITGCNPRDKKFPLNCDVVYKDTPDKNGPYKIAMHLFKELKRVGK